MAARSTTELVVEVINSVEELEALPGYTKNIDPAQVELDTIIAVYDLPNEIACQKKTCHQPHNNGCVVKLSDGNVTNIGNKCGKKLYSEKFTLQKLQADRYIKRMNVVRLLTAKKQNDQSIKDTLTSTHTSAKTVTDLIKQLEVYFGSKLVNKIRSKALKQEYDVYTFTQLTEKEIEIRRETGNASKRVLNEERIKVGTLAYIDFFAKDVRSMYFDKIYPAYTELLQADIDSMPTPALNKLQRKISDAERASREIPDIETEALSFSQHRKNFELLNFIADELPFEEASLAKSGIDRYIHMNKQL
ncbi:hypothetical protein [Chromobacterium violaceum]|uniref:hypothetical protein n=1 Tax=Chromobacterium violaceum TaxID=536 RepID=UPI000B0856BB|nr:hypothetical protein [Chromobacterium violaceum]